MHPTPMALTSLCEELRLDPAKNNIRLLLLDRRRPRHILRCYLAVYSLNEWCLPYRALSYAWGDPNATTSISVNGHGISVTRALGSALRHIQDDSSERDKEGSGVIVIWADAICINQTSIEEKNHQVSLMFSVYEKASGVIAWLGDADKDSVN